MTINLKPYKNDLLFLPLGGAGEIGMNLNLYYHQGKWLMIDLGAGFADDYYPGVDVIVPDIEFIRERKKDLVGLVLTHAHEDHLGAVGYLIEELKCPIYATKFTLNFLKAKLADIDPDFIPKLIEVKEDSNFQIGPFDLELLTITHSTPEMQSVVIRTNHGNIFHTGDWKFDPKPMLGKNTEFDRLKKLGKEGCLAIIGDSTNVFKEEPSGSEGELRESLNNLIGECQKMVIVTTFASNVARLETLIKAGKKHGRKVCLAGRSLWRIYDAAKSSGYLEDIGEIYTDKEIMKFPRHEIMIVATGCQGEPFAATTKIAFDNHPTIRMSKGDTIIFSSKIIPGNEKKIYRLFNQFVHIGAEVFTEKDHFVHVSGHPSASELREMYKMTKPEISIPVHGELVHMHEHVRLAKEFGVKHALQIENGDLVKIAPGEPELLKKVKSGYIAVDGLSLINADSVVIRMRRKLMKDGIVIANLIFNNDGKLVARPKVLAPGLLDPKNDQLIMFDIEAEMEEVLNDHFHKSKRNKKHTEQIENLTRQVVRRNVRFNLGKNPVIDVNITKINTKI